VNSHEDDQAQPEGLKPPHPPVHSDCAAKYEAGFERKAEPLNVEIMNGEPYARAGEEKANDDVGCEVANAIGGHLNRI
jgi:hypothetical protein